MCLEPCWGETPLQVRACNRDENALSVECTKISEDLSPSTRRCWVLLDKRGRCVYVCFSAFFSLFPPPPDPRPTVLDQAALQTCWTEYSQHCTVQCSWQWAQQVKQQCFVWADTDESCQLYIFFFSPPAPSLFMSTLFQSSVNFTLLAGKRRPCPALTF